MQVIAFFRDLQDGCLLTVRQFGCDLNHGFQVSFQVQIRIQVPAHL